jgi:sugar transferase (PEP-CTERM/EpsH1 system associated)
LEPLLFLCHRIPVPPNKGEKIRAYNLIRGLARRYRIVLGGFVDDASDWAHLPELRALCAELHAEPLDPRHARIRSLAAVASGEPLTLPYYRSERFARWVHDAVPRHRVSRAFAYSSAMAQYVLDRAGLRVIVDLVDVDSDKWAQYARTTRPPMSWIYAREARRLRAFEREIGRRADASLLVTETEARLFRELVPERASRAFTVPMGVDVEHYAPRADRASPFAPGELPIVFTGVMDYWPNVDAATWFAREILPPIVAAEPRARLYLVGMNPAPAVQALARDPRIVVTGRVEDTRPFVQHARVAVAPMRLARGVQTKVLEAMAMGRPVVVSTACVEALDARPGIDLEVAGDAVEFARAVLRLLAGSGAEALGQAARARITERYSWQRSVTEVERLLEGRPEGGQLPAAAPAPLLTVAD